jgi:cyclopropane-fatty-acyl-phospholipid synthase
MLSLDRLLEKDLLPDALLRLGIRRLLRQRLRESVRATPAEQARAIAEFAAAMRTSPIALQTEAANEQHYEVPTAFFQHCLGPRMKYSSALWTDATPTLREAEEAMLALTCERAGLADGQDILELGCGWGSLSLWMAERYPAARIVGVSNSKTQKAYLDVEIRRRGLRNLRIETCDMNRFRPPAGSFDRVVSVEMFEHMRNWAELLERVSGWLRPDGRLFIHIFTHQVAAYAFEARDESDWMSRYFFSGGIMPSHGLLGQFNDHLAIEEEWKVSGLHYARTADAWLENMDRNRAAIMPLLASTYGAANAQKWWAYWRIFFLSCSQLWGFRGGEEWLVSHYRLAPRRKADSLAPQSLAARAPEFAEA